MAPMKFSRYVALGDSFTEGVGDPDPTRPNGLRGWADRVAEVLAGRSTRLRLRQPGHPRTQAAPDPRRAARARPAPSRPTWSRIHAGANDVLRPRVDLDDLASAYDAAVGRIVETGAHVVMFTIFDPGSSGIYAAMRGRMAIFNEFAREISERHDATLVDMWRMRDRPIAEVMDTDRMHLNASGHQHIAFAVLAGLGVTHDEEPLAPASRRRR